MHSVLPTIPSPESEQSDVAKIVSSQTQRQITSISLSTPVCLLLALILPVFAIAPLFYPGYIQTHSGFVPLWNAVDLRANLGDLSWMPHIATSFDPFRSDGLLPYYLAGLLPLTPVSAVKLVMGLGWLLGSVGMFLWLKSWLGNPGALVAALVYTYLPHQITTVYVRGAWGESLFWGLLPWAILAATYLVTSPKVILLPLAAFFWLWLGLSQLGLTIWALLLVIALLLVVHRPQAALPILSALLGVAAAIAVYLFLSPYPLFTPAIAPFTDHFLYPFQLVSAYWGFGHSRLGWNDGLSLQIGLAAIGLAVIGVFLWQRNQPSELEEVSRTDRRLIFFLSAAIILTLLQFSPTAFLWNLPPGYSLSNTLTYPWQLLGLVGLCLSILAGAALWLDLQLRRLPLLGAIIIIVILSVYPYLLPQFVQLDSRLTSPPQAELGDAQLMLLSHNFSVLTSGHTVGLERGQTSIPLALHGPLQANNILVLNVVWQPLQPFADDLKVFVHLVDSNDNVLAQFDGRPQEGTHPTSRWISGEIINDAYPILVPPDAPPGPYRVFIGLYNQTTLQRLPVPTDSAGRVILDVQ